MRCLPVGTARSRNREGLRRTADGFVAQCTAGISPRRFWQINWEVVLVGHQALLHM
jgi:hypothetical protein